MIFSDPKTGELLAQEIQAYVGAHARYPVIDGIPSFVRKEDIFGDNEKYQKFYDRVGKFTGSVFWFLCALFKWDTVSKRKDLLSDLFVKPGDLVLETSIGAGANIPALEKEAEYVGVDISMGMLKACQRYPLLKPYRLALAQANAEELPFKDNTFDVVFHFGGINFFNDPKRAIREMIRVAKPGAQIWIGDETQKYVDAWYKKIPFVARYFQEAVVRIPEIPHGVENPRIFQKWDGEMYVMTFRKTSSR